MPRSTPSTVELVHRLLDRRLDVQTHRHWLDQCIDAQAVSDPSDLDWPAFFERSGNALITPVLHTRVQALGLALPDDVMEALAEVHAKNTARNRQLVQATTRLTHLLNSVDVHPIPLKGAALLLGGHLEAAGDRLLSDIDLLIEPEQAGKVLHVLQSAGYRQVRNLYDTRTDDPGHGDFVPIDLSDFRNKATGTHHHLPQVSKADEGVGIELHTRLCAETHGPGGHLNTLAWQNLQPAHFHGAHYQCLTVPTLLLHTLQHSLLNDGALSGGLIDYRHWQDADGLLAQMVAADELPALRQAIEATDMEPCFSVFLWLSQHEFGCDRWAQWHASAAGRTLIEQFQRTRHSRWRQRWIGWRTTAARGLQRFFSAEQLANRYGPMPATQARLLYLRYVGARARALVAAKLR